MSSSTTVRTARRRRTLRMAAAALTAAAGLTLTACSGSDDTGTKPAGHTDTEAAAESSGAGSSTGAQGSGAQASPGAKADTKADSKAGAAGKQSGGSHAANGAGAGSDGRRCHTSGLKASFATGDDAVPDPNAGGSTTTSIVLTNKGSRTCVIGGFPGVDLKSENGGERWSLARSSKKFSSITLKPGDSTDFTINLALTKEEEGFYQPAYADITPPNETTALTLKWPWGTLVDQRAATHPATFVNPIG
ncbi:DUF4232 domain-containing protein [Streptomyces sp. Je 1-4]|uniref:DUF4232 domain-containing protein n=1 Tax=Streptomyces TaxID=1883 RepID=UPI0021D8CD3C|nr:MULTISPECIES: DUF4232 domain-containing protein [unclassified Streptomyces]UYB38586.1 DUF4232 domain-containing protein [Streptomyces sp. Je 1-4]UZQ34553.1 DUF4232 domain-containing protein [Streptomyces sp. Je 1-4] [Streptomyces sp. Je 1-4 4N24]UZQ41971.1 DUF4232 domain-containing protein [Streptomyces sp. Je 1-4] [Streptomyces sp. Je 1-4 4N24_ara]